MAAANTIRVLLRLVAVLQICLPTTVAFAYDRLAARAYALRYGGDFRNPAYESYPNDCTNFVSQCLRAGGIRFTSEQGYLDAYQSLVRAAELPEALTQFHGAYSSVLRFPYDQYPAMLSGMPGDAIALSVDAANNFHSVTIDTRLSETEIYVSAHTNNHLHRALSDLLVLSYDANANGSIEDDEYPITFSFLHIADSPVVISTTLRTSSGVAYLGTQNPDLFHDNPSIAKRLPIGPGFVDVVVQFDTPIPDASGFSATFGSEPPFLQNAFGNGTWSETKYPQDTWVSSVEINTGMSSGKYQIRVSAQGLDGSLLDADEDLSVYNPGPDVSHLFFVDTDRPSLVGEFPQGSDIDYLTNTVSFQLTDPEVNGVVSGIDLASAADAAKILPTIDGYWNFVPREFDVDAEFTVLEPLTPATTYTVTVSDVRDLAGNTMEPYSWSFTTESCPPCTDWNADKKECEARKCQDPEIVDVPGEPCEGA